MKNLKRMLALVMAMVMLLLASSIAEGQEGTELELLPPENAEALADVPVDEPLPEGEDTALEEPATLKLDQTSAILDYSQGVVLTAIAPEGAEFVTWTSSDENVASLSADTGESVEVVGINEGTATITCASGELTQTCEVTVKAPETLQITGVDYPSTFQNAGRGWKLRNGTVASVDDLAELTSEIKNANGELIGNSYTQTFSEGEKRYDIKGIDSYVPFSRITEEGQYTWTLSATDVSGRMVSIDLPIHVTATEDTAVSSAPGAYSQGVPVPENSTGNEGNEATAPSVDEVNGIEPVGRNRVLNGAFEKGQRYWDNWGDPATREFVEQDGKTWCHIVSTPNARWQGLQQNPYGAHGITVTGYDQYTVSVRVKGSTGNEKFTLGIHWRDRSGTISQTWNSWTIGTEEQILTYTVTAFPGSESFNLMVGVDDVNSEVIHDIYFTDIKFEFGNTATAWSPAPEDVHALGDGINKVVNSAFEQGQENWNNWGEPTTREFVDEDGKTWCHIVSTANARWQGVQQNAYESHNITVAGYDPYTFSARVKGASENTKFTMGIHWKNAEGTFSQTWNTWTIGTEEQTITYTVTAVPGSRFFNLMLGIDDVDSETIHDVYFTDIKFELGDAATEWSSAPEDEADAM